RARRAGNARCDSLPVVLDAGARRNSVRVSRRARCAGVRLRHLSGRLSVEPRCREATCPGSDPGRGRTACVACGLVAAGAGRAASKLRATLRAEERLDLSAAERARRAWQYWDFGRPRPARAVPVE